MNITSLPEGGATYRVVKTVANGNFNNGPATALTLGENTKSVAGVAFDRTVKFQFSSGDIEFDALSVNGVDAGCLGGAPADVPGCTDDAANNYNADANVDDGSCAYDVPGCTDAAALNYNADANVDDGSCNYPPTTATVEFAVDMNGVDQPSADYDQVVVNGSWNGWQGWGVVLADEDGDGVFTGSLEVDPGTSFEYVSSCIQEQSDGWSGFWYSMGCIIGCRCSCL